MLYLATMGAMMCLWACKPTQNTAQDTQKSAKGVWIFEAKNTFSAQEEVKIQAYHEQSMALNLQRPLELILEVEEKGNWRTVRKLYCPCNENCPNPPLQKSVEAKERISFQWTPQEQWCESSLRSAPAPKGKYRLEIRHTVTGDKKVYVQYFEFTLK